MILSVVIPCYNHGQYLQEAIDSVLSYKDQPFELIIVDDGSTDFYTINKMQELIAAGYHVIQQENSGLAKTRNVGISIAKGKYILPLDADNKIKADYIRKAIQLLEGDKCDIVYSKPSFFGDITEDRKFSTHEFNGEDLIFGNYIDACAIYRKEVWIKNGGYDENMPYPGVEDWEFWIHSFINKFNFKFIDEALYYYRILEKSMIVDVFKENNYENCKKYIFTKHYEFTMKVLWLLKCQSDFYENDQRHPLRSVFKYIKKFFST